jgi:hypothetical protein
MGARTTDTAKRTGVGARRPLLAAVLALATFAGLTAGCGGSHRAAPAPHRTSTAGVTVTTTSQAKSSEPPAIPVGEAIVATAAHAGTVAVYRWPGESRPYVRLPNPRPSGAPLTFLVRSRLPGWEQVYLPIRPDESTGWVRDRDLRLALDPYSLQVHLGAHQLVLRRHGRIVARMPAGVGRGVLPTPLGHYYIVELLKQPDPSGPYGPYAFGTSAYSHVLFSFGGGPGQIGVHGTNEPSSVGRDASHGCIRIHNRDIRRLAAILPLGTPITISR